jgi:hypothetical protein
MQASRAMTAALVAALLLVAVSPAAGQGVSGSAYIDAYSQISYSDRVIKPCPADAVFTQCYARPCATVRCAAGTVCRDNYCAGCNAYCEPVSGAQTPAEVVVVRPPSKVAPPPAPLAYGSDCANTDPATRQRCLLEWVYSRMPSDAPSCRNLPTQTQRLACADAWVDAEDASCGMQQQQCINAGPLASPADCGTAYQRCINQWILRQQVRAAGAWGNGASTSGS